ncbi:hypothetical protein ACEPAF_6087 [Sanghuangporus sanghuang]
MSSARYERLPTSPDRSRSPVGSPASTSLDLGEEEANIGRRQPPPANRVVYAHDPRFGIPTPPAWQRVALIAFVVFLFWLGFRIRGLPVEEGIPAVVE